MAEAARKTDKELIAEAADWLAALDGGSASEDAFAAWRDADPRHASAFAQVAATWGQLAGLRGLAGTGAPAPHAEPTVERPSRRRFLAQAAAAATVLAAGGGAALWLRDPRHQVVTATGERRTVPLPDGSTMELNTDTRLAWAFADAGRAVWILQGEAALTVAADAARPFLVHAGDAIARLNAGRFNVRLRDEGAEFMALIGNGRIDAARATLALAPDRTVRAGADGLRAAAITTVEANNLVAWQSGEIVFDGISLASAVDEFNRYLGRKMVVDDPAISAIRLGGRFHIDDPRGFLDALRTGFGIRANDQGGQTLLTRG